MSPVMVSGLDPPNTGVWQSNVERARLRSFSGRHGPNAHPARLEQRSATGPVKTSTQKIGRRAVYGVSGSQRPDRALNARKRLYVKNVCYSGAGPNPTKSPQHHCRPKTRTKNPRDQAGSRSRIPGPDGGSDQVQSINIPQGNRRDHQGP